MAPGSSCGAEGDGGTAPLAVTGPSVTQCVVSLLHATYCLPLKDVFGQLRTTYAAGWCLDFVTSEHEEPSEGTFLCSPFAFFGGVEMSECVPSCAIQACLAIESVLSEVNFFVSSKRNFNILVDLEELNNNAFRRSLKIRPLKTVASSPFEPHKYDVRWKHRAH